MGNPKTSPSLRPSDDAVSLHTQPDRYLDDDAPELADDDLPPLYEENPSSSSSAPLIASTPVRTRDTVYSRLVYHSIDQNTGAVHCIDGSFDRNPQFLEDMVKEWAELPPRASIRIHGTHTETVDNKGKSEKKKVTDFDVEVDVTPYLYRDAVTRASWKELRTVENSEKVRRGTVLRKRAPGSTQSVELGLADKPTLAEWCHRYCASHAGLKCFAMQRRMIGFDDARMKEKVHNLVRATNYRGHVDITFPVRDAVVEVYNDCKTSRWRLNNWIFWLCIFTLTFLFTWPYLFFRTKRFEVAVVDWPFSRIVESGNREYISLSEDQLYNMWARAINRAILSKRQGTLDQSDLQASEGAEPTFGDDAPSFVRAGISAMNHVSRQFGWGRDS